MNFTTILTSQSGFLLMKEMLQSRFQGISGAFRLTDGRLIQKEFEIVNVFRGERTIGYWNPENGITSILKEENHIETKLTSSSKLESVIWHGGTKAIPKGLFLHGKRLRIAVPVKIGFQELIRVIRDPQTNETTVTGFCADVFKEAIKSLDYEVNHEFIPSVNVDGGQSIIYDELILGVYQKNFDAVVGDITILASRFPYVDFTQPFTDLGIGVVVPKINNNSIWIFLKPLSVDLWITTAAFFIFTGIVVWLIEHSINDEFQGSPSEQIGTVFWYSFSTLVFAHKEKLLSNLSKFVVIVWVFAVLIITSSYTATLTSMLTVQQIQSSSRNAGVGTSADFLLLRGVNKSTYENPAIKPYHKPEEYADALTRGSKNGGVSAIIDEIPYLQIFLAKYPSDYTMTKSMAKTGGFGFAFPKGSPLVQDMSSAILRLREEGKLKMMEDKWFNSTEPILSNQDSASTVTSRLSVHSFGGLFLVTAVSSSAALLVCLFQKRRSISVSNFKSYLNCGIDSVKGYFRSSR
ncbi:DNA repair protein XRCC3-like protein [Hibiscus syriacus]|uniref:DNA repair protein XRCC3-like protein n=1 Tax=Hibiscus syriacus TaxID=106335 RepID=A0A6A2ZWE4_HIBSY|nr:glutamate receptor 2.8-like [Hibiscus syriacus]KAE8696158.1 DNA repair protein XRCC3-like protein [Hibiscus syriacus]